MKHGEDKTRTIYYASSALTYLLAMVCSNLALQWVGYPTQVRKIKQIIVHELYLK